MKRIKSIVFFAICTFFVYCANTMPAAAVEFSDTDSISESGVNTKALEWGFKFASAIPVKPHIDDRSKSQYSVLDIYLEKKLPEKAIDLSGRIADWRRCLFYADLAYYFAGTHQEEKVQTYLDHAGECRGRLEGFQAGWQQDRILLRMAEAMAVAGKWEDVEKTEADLSPESVLSTAVFRAGCLNERFDNYEERINQLQPMEASEYMEIKRDVARAYIAILEQLGKEATVQQRETLQTRIYSVSKELPLLVRNDLLCSLTRVAFEAGHGDLGRKVFDYTEKQLKGREFNARYDVAALSALSQIWQLSGGESERSASLLHEASALLSESTLKTTDQVKAMIALAQGYGVFGKEGKAWDYFFKALQTAASQVNARPRAMAITRVCIGIAQWGAPTPDDLEVELARLYDGLGDPW